MKRKIETIFAQWKSTPNHKPLIVKGCRQCGKTYSVLEFAKTHYKNVVYIDFHRYETYRTLFSGSLEPDDILMKISSAFPNISLIPKDTYIGRDTRVSACASSTQIFALGRSLRLYMHRFPIGSKWLSITRQRGYLCIYSCRLRNDYRYVSYGF